MKATIVRPLPEYPEREKKEGLFFQEGRTSFKAECILYHAGVLLLEGYDYKAKYKEQIELLAGCFIEGSNIEEVLRSQCLMKPWQRLYGILILMGNIPVLISRYNNDPEEIYEELERQIRMENMNIA